MKPCWRDRGLTEAGARQADSALPVMLDIISRIDMDIARIALEEARFRLYELPTRTAAYRRQYIKDNQ